MNEINALAESQINDSHYLKSVTTLGDVSPVVASRDIHSASGIKLVNAGMRIDSSLYERLLQHKLVPPLDQCLTAKNTVTGDMLATEAAQLMRNDDRLAMIQTAQTAGTLLPEFILQIPLNPAIAFKLTVMRETQADLFEHSLYVALVSTYIGMQLNLGKKQLVQLATAALLHDIGILHIDPGLLARGHKMSESERRHLYVHSVTGWMILRNYPEYTEKVLDGVLHHHERLDGSGYPRGLKSDEIDQFGQIIAVAEIIASRYGRENIAYGWSRLETILKLNLRRYGRNLVHHLKVFYRGEKEIPRLSDEDKRHARDNLARIGKIFAIWEVARAKCTAGDPVCAFINERMLNLKMEIVDAGLAPEADSDSLNALQDDPQACFDAKILLDETLWQLHSILRETRRRWPSLDTGSTSPGADALQSWIKESGDLL